MPLQIIRIYPHLESLYRARRLPTVCQEQIRRLFERFLNEQGTGDATLAFIGHIFGYDQNMAVVDGYRVVSEDQPDITLYDFWRFAYADGVLFHAGSVAPAGIEMVDRNFCLTAGVNDPEAQLQALAAALNDASPVDAPGLDEDAPFLLEHVGVYRYLVGFKEPDAQPTTPAGWDELLGGEYLKMHEDFARLHIREFGPLARRYMWARCNLSEAFIREFAKTEEDWRYISTARIAHD